MPTFLITEHAVTVTDDRGDELMVRRTSGNYHEAVMAVMEADWALYKEVALSPEPEVEDDEDEVESFLRLEQHDLRNWNGSPIYYLTREQAEEQVASSMGFWKYHDFGISARCGRRYATVPTGFGPTAPEGYEWACVSIED